MNETFEANDPNPESMRPDYLLRLDEAFKNRHDLSEAVTNAFIRSHQYIPVAVRKQLIELSRCRSSEDILASGSLAPMLPLLRSFRSPNPESFIRLLEDFVSMHTFKRFGMLRYWSYPTILAGLLAIVMIVQAWIVSPVFEAMFADFGLRLPWTTKWLFGINQWIRNYFVQALVAVLIIGGACYFFRRAFVVFLERVQHWPIVSWLSRGSNSNLFAMHRCIGTLAELIDLGVPSPEACRVAGLASQRSFYRNAATCLSISDDPMKTQKVITRFPPMLVQILQSPGDNSTKVPALRCLADLYLHRAMFRRAKAFVGLQPLAILFLGLLIGCITISLFMPLISLVTSLA